MVPNEVQSTDSTHIPITQGFFYLTAVLNLHPRHVLRLELSNTLDAGFCPQVLAAALRQAPAPYVFNPDQGSQFTCPAFEQTLLAAGCHISHGGWGRATDNAFTERFWRTNKCERIYLIPADDSQHLLQ